MKIRDFKFGTIQVGHGKSYPTDDIKPFLKWGVVNHVIDSFFGFGLIFGTGEDCKDWIANLVCMIELG